MNLIQIQERLKDVPLNAVITYANGSNPDIPPYLALAEIQRRNSAQQKAQQAQPPDSSVKDQIERKAMEQGTNQLAADQAKQQQARQQMIQQLSQQQQSIPEGLPQPEGMPEAAFADGGIVGLPVNSNMFNFNSGGIVSFADGKVVKAKPVQKKVAPPPPKDYMTMAEEALKVQPEMPSSPTEMLEAAKLTNPALQRPIGEDYSAKIKQFEQQDVSNRQAFEDREKAAQRRDFWNSLIAAGEASRGGGGIGSLLGGFGKSYGASQGAADERRARQEAARREQDMSMAKLNFEVQNLQRAEARGDVEAAYKHKAEIAKIQADLQKDKAIGYTNLGNLQRQKEYNDIVRAQIGQSGQQIGQSGQQQAPEFVKLVEYFKKQNPNLTNEQAYKLAAGYSRQGIAGDLAGERQASKNIVDIQKRYTMSIQMARQAGNKSLEEILTRQMQNEIREATGGVPGEPGQSPVPTGFKVTREK